MKIKTSELIGHALNWAVAEAIGSHSDIGLNGKPWEPPYSTDWSQGGPIIEREGIDLNYSNYEGTSGEVWDAACEVNRIFGGPTPLIAAMRCFVASRLGDEVEIPEELV